MQRRQLIKCLTAGALFSSLLPAFATEPVTLAKKGINLKIIEFTDYIQPNLALADKEIDANLF